MNEPIFYIKVPVVTEKEMRDGGKNGVRGEESRNKREVKESL